jgi:hypothetical protein
VLYRRCYVYVRYEKVLEAAAGLVEEQHTVNFVNIVLMLVFVPPILLLYIYIYI